MKWTELEKKQLIIFALIAFGLPILMGILMGYSYFQGNDVSTFPNAQMYYPAAGVMLALFLAGDKEKSLPKKFYIGFLGTTVVMMLTAVFSIFTPQFNWAVYGQIPIIILSIVCLILLLTEKKEIRGEYGLRFVGKRKGNSWLCIFLFLAIYILRLFLSCLIEGEITMFVDVFKNPMTHVTMVSLLPSFFLVFTAFLGEEYGWRFFFQPLLQKRFGLKGGVLILGVLWGLWHLPINIFFYSPDTWVISVVLQIITCISLGIFFGYGYSKTGNIWVPVAMHFLNNNMIAVVTGSADISNQVYRLIDIPLTLLVDLIFIVFFFSKEYREKKAS